MKRKDETGHDVADDDFQTVRNALRRMPTPEPRAGFVERAFARAAAHHREPRAALPGRLHGFATRWETWAGAALGGAIAAALTFLLLRPADPTVSQQPQLALTLHEARTVEVLIDAERELRGATIRIAASGSIALDGFDDERRVDWQADLDRGRNSLSLPVVARAAGKGRLVAVIEHEGRTRQVAIELSVIDPNGADPEVSRS